jgi:hypothetical protein
MRAQDHHAASVQQAPGRHHHWRVLQGHDGRLGTTTTENLFKWRETRRRPGFEKTRMSSMSIPEQECFDNAVLMVAMVRLAWSWPRAMGERGHRAGSRPTTSPLHETPHRPAPSHEAVQG